MTERKRGVGARAPVERSATAHPTRVLGIDPGSTVTGFGVIERLGSKIVHVAHGTLRPKGSSLAARLAQLHRMISEVVEGHAPDVASVEQVFVSTSPRAALVLGQARGVALAALAALGVGVEEYAPASIKQSVTGSGRAPKRQVQEMVGRLLALERKPAQDAADALAAAICHAHAGKLVGMGAARTRGSRAVRGASLRVRRPL